MRKRKEQFHDTNSSSESKDKICEVSAQKNHLLITIKGQPEKEVYVESVGNGIPRYAKVDYYGFHSEDSKNQNPLHIQQITKIRTIKGTLLYDENSKPTITADELKKLNGAKEF